MKIIIILGCALVLFLSSNMFAEETIKGWEFNGEKESEGWLKGSSRIKNKEIKEGILKGEITTNYGDPQLNFQCPTPVDSSKIKYLKIRMKIKTADKRVQFFLNIGIKGRNSSVTFDIIGDGEFNEYIVPLYNAKNWDNVGKIENVRLDPTASGRAGDKFEVDYIRLVTVDVQKTMK